MNHTPHRLVVVALALVVVASTAGARTLEQETDMTGVDTLILEIGVGDVVITAAEGATAHATIELAPRRGGFFSSLKRAERDVAEAELSVRRDGSTVTMKVASRSDDRRFEEDWTLRMPTGVSLELEMGVGDLEIHDTDARVEIELGVGDTTLTARGGDLSIEVGVGDVQITSDLGDTGLVEAEAGVGTVTIRAGAETVHGEGFVSHAARWRGDGAASIDAESGVGDIRVRLE